MKIIYKRTHFNTHTESWRRILVVELEAGEAPEPNELFYLGDFHPVTPNSAYSPTGQIYFEEPWVELLKHLGKVWVRIEQRASIDT